MTTVEIRDPLVRQERLAGRVGRLRSRGGDGSLDRWLLLVGGALMPLGFLLVVLGWAGASRTPLLFEQVPYLISGGLLGVSLVLSGGFLYFAYWQTLLVRESRTARADLQTSLGRLETLLASGAMLDLNGSGSAGAAAGGNGHVQLVATQSGSMMHRPDCTVVASRPNLRPVPADEPGLTACGLCAPLAVAP